MSKEKKFRARTTELGTWHYGSNGVITQANEHPLSEFFKLIEIGMLDSETIGDFTGLKDKNGKEIYDGDIIQFLLPDWTWSNPQMVQYCHSSFVTKSGNLWGLGFDPDIVHDEKLEYLEVIGNIYENPELLETETKQEVSK